MRTSALPLTSRLRRLHWTGLAMGVALLVWVLIQPALAAPAEGTAGQTVTNRSLHRPDGHQRPTGTLIAAATDSKPAWKELSPVQRQALQPLESHWDRLTEERKRKWLVISKNYPTLSPTEQLKMHRRMSEWITLSQQQRMQARQNYTEIKKLTPEQKATEWEAYQALSPEEKRKLATQAPARKPAGLAAGKPGASPKLTAVPRRATPHGGTNAARMAEKTGAHLQPHTLLPRQELQSKDSEHSASPYEDEPAE